MSKTAIFWALIATATIVLFSASWAIELIVDYYWFGTLGYPQIFSTVVWSKMAIGLVGIGLAFIILVINFLYAVRQLGDPSRYLPSDLLNSPLGGFANPKSLRWLAIIASLVLAILTGVGIASMWDKVLLYINAVPYGYSDPIFERDASFYVFVLPFYTMVQNFLWSSILLALVGSVAVYYFYFRCEQARVSMDEISLLAAMPRGMQMHLAVLGAVLLILLAVGQYLARFELMHESGGLFTGPGYADITGTLPMLTLRAIVAIFAAVGLVIIVSGKRWRGLLYLVGTVVVVWFVSTFYAPLVQHFIVAPNELEKERTYLSHHILATNRAYALDQVLVRNLGEEDELTMDDINRNRATINNVRLWDHEPLLDTFGQIQEIRTYYDFVSVDNDRYRLGDELRQTMLSPRELNNESLPSRTWVNERLTFTHGYGLTVGPVNRVNEQGLPVLYVQDLPPESTAPELEVTRPEIYYGEVTRDYVFVNTRQQEFNYPEGDQNIFSTYEGDGGLLLSNLWRRLLLSAFTGDLKMLLSDDFTDETRILIYRNINQRIRKLAPFLNFDRDPYMVIDNGRLFWIFDAYTISDRFPYAEHYGRLGNYVRNPVKAVVDAYNGKMTLYMVDPDEPIARAWSRAFSNAIQPISEMSSSLRAHLRHPVDYFTVQAEMYATYHMLEVNTFYNKEDQWSVPEVGNVRMEPYYTVMRLPEESQAEFILMLPFTPRLKDNLAAWMVARNDGDLLSQLVVYAFPKQRLIYGPKQMVGRINQDPEVSQQITLWDRAGSSVIRGTLLVIPVEQSLLYIQPLYLRAEDGRIPELKRVIVGYGNEIAMGVDLEDGLDRIFADSSNQQSAQLEPVINLGSTTSSQYLETPPAGDASARARQHYESMLEAAKAGDWARFGHELDRLGQSLQELESSVQ